MARAAGIPWVEVAVGLSAFDERVLPLLEAPLVELGAQGGVEALRSGPRLSLGPGAVRGPKRERLAKDKEVPG